MGDPPTTEELLWGMLYELGFTSFLERGKLCKRISAEKAAVPARHFIDNATRAIPGNCTTTNTIGLLSDPGQRGLAAACRSFSTQNCINGVPDNSRYNTLVTNATYGDQHQREHKGV